MTTLLVAIILFALCATHSVEVGEREPGGPYLTFTLKFFRWQRTFEFGRS